MKQGKWYQTSPFLYIGYNSELRDKCLIDTLFAQVHSLNAELLDTLTQYRNPTEFDTILSEIGAEVLEILLTKGLLVASDEMWKQTQIENLEIEVCTHCNWRCEYCPVKYDPKPGVTMSMELFREIIEKACRHTTIKYVTLNSFNEPALDRYFAERIALLAQTNLKLILHTNGSMLDEHKVTLLKESGVVAKIYFNLPRLDPVEFPQITGSNSYEQTIKNIEYTIASGLPVDFSVQRVGNNDLENLQVMNERYSQLIGKRVTSWETLDRAGLLKNQYQQNIYLTGHLAGCRAVLRWMYIGVDGNCFICHHDYYQREVYGNIRNGEISDILESEQAQRLRAKVFGSELAGEDFICRRCYEMNEFTILQRMSRKIRRDK